MHFEDVYYVLDVVFFIRAIAMFLLLMWFLYMFTFRFLFSGVLVWMHIIITIAIAVAVSALLLWKAKTYATITDVDMIKTNIRRATFMTQLFTVSIMLTQMLFFLNLLAGVFKRVN